jgi:hypothetical protein
MGQYRYAVLLGCLSVPAMSQEQQQEPISALTVEQSITIGEDATKSIDTNLDGHPVPADIGQIFIGNTAESADAITIDSGSNFPPGIAFRRYLGDPNAPQVVTAGTQLGYLDFRAYSGSQFFNAGSLDVVVDGAIPFPNGSLPATQMRFAVSDGNRVYIPMELRGNGRLELGALDNGQYYGPGSLGDPKFFVNTNESKWAAILAARPVDGPAFALRLHTSGESASDYLIGASSGEDSGTFKFSVRGNGDVYAAGDLIVQGRDVLSELTSLDSAARILSATVSEIDLRTSQNAIDLAALSSSTDDRFAETNGRLDDVEDRVGSLENANGALAADLDAVKERVDANTTRLSHLEGTQLEQQTKLNNFAVGTDGNATATGENSLALGPEANAGGPRAIAIGADSDATGGSATAIGNGTIATGLNSVAFGNGARANGASAIAHGDGALASGTGNVAVGSKSQATATGSVALGSNAKAVRNSAVAIGNSNLAQGARAIALGSGTVAIGDNATALGAGASVRHENSTAVGAGATTTAANQVMLGAKNTSVVIADIDASTEAQVGPVDAVTIDASGTLGRRKVATESSVDAVRVSVSQIAAVSDSQFSALTGRVSYIEGQVSRLFDLSQTIDHDAKQGIAAIAAMAHPHFPSEAGKTSYASNVSAYRGEIGFSAGAMHRFEGDFALSAGVTYAGGSSTAVRVGVAGEF